MCVTASLAYMGTGSWTGSNLPLQPHTKSFILVLKGTCRLCPLPEVWGTLLWRAREE